MFFEAKQTSIFPFTKSLDASGLQIYGFHSRQNVTSFFKGPSFSLSPISSGTRRDETVQMISREFSFYISHFQVTPSAAGVGGKSRI